MKYCLKKAASFLLLLFLCSAILTTVIVGPYIAKAFVVSDYYHWPKLTKCPICEQKIWAWHDYERRQYPVSFENNVDDDSPIRIISVTKSSLFHKNCKGLPEEKEPALKIEPIPRVPVAEDF